MSDDAIISTDMVAKWWGQPPEFRSVPGRERLEAAIWSGGPREISGDPDPEMNIICMPLIPYHARAFKNGKAIENTVWKRGTFQTMAAGVRPFAELLSNWRMLHVFLPMSTLRRVSEDHGLPRSVELVDPQGMVDPAMAQVFYALEGEVATSSPPSSLMIESLGVQLAVLLLRRWSNFKHAQPFERRFGRGDKQDWRIRRVLEYLEAHLGEDIRLDELASIADLSSSHLASLFRAGTGESPHRWLTRRRIERACEMLCELRLSVTEIALACGFASSQHFATAFRKYKGMTPTDYRRGRLS